MRKLENEEMWELVGEFRRDSEKGFRLRRKTKNIRSRLRGILKEKGY